jgi:tetratricopeptide (TPR) repeat protein
MDHYAIARRLSDQGRYADALEDLQRGFSRRDRIDGEIFLAELFDKVGRVGDASTLVESLRKVRGLSPAQRGRCEFILSRAYSQKGDHDATMQCLQRSLILAREGHDLEQACWAELRLLGLIADREGPEAAGGLISTLRRDVTQLGVASVTAALHVFVAMLAGKRGYVANARHHTRIAKAILSASPHAWLETWTYSNEIALCLLTGDLQSALSFTDRVMPLAQQSGAPFLMAGVWANLGNVFLARGDLNRAGDHLARAVNLLPGDSESAAAVQESLARLSLAKGDLQRCRELLALLERSARSRNTAGLYVHRHAQLTNIELLVREGRVGIALEVVERVIELSSRSSDDYLVAKLHLIRGRLLAHNGDMRALTAAVDLIGPQLTAHPIDLYATYEATLGAARSEGEPSALHASRANRAWQSLGEHSLQAEATVDLPAGDCHAAKGPVAAGASLQAIAALFMFSGRPELMCQEVAQVLRLSGCIEAAETVARPTSGTIERSTLFGVCHDGLESQTIVVSEGIELRVRPRSDVESHATLAAVRMLLSRVREFERAQAEREERQTLWPADDLPAEDENAVVLGKMRDVMILARKVAGLNVAVLITGAMRRYSNQQNRGLRTARGDRHGNAPGRMPYPASGRAAA